MTRRGHSRTDRSSGRPGSFECWDEPIDQAGYEIDYLAELKLAEERAGTDETVFTGRCSRAWTRGGHGRQRVRVPRRFHRDGDRCTHHRCCLTCDP